MQAEKKVAFLFTGCPSLQPFVPCAWDCSIIHRRDQSCIALAGAIWHLASLGKRKKFQHHHEANRQEKRHRSGCTSTVTQCTTLLRIKAVMKVSYAHQCVVPQKGSHFATTAYAVRGSQVSTCSRTCAIEQALKADTLQYGRKLACCLVCQSKGLWLAFIHHRHHSTHKTVRALHKIAWLKML